VVLGDPRIWQEYGDLVESMQAYLPGFFGRTPRNPAKKINSGFKACEYLIYIWVLGPALFRLYLPHDLWVHYCKLVRAIRILHQRQISALDLTLAHRLLLEWELQFELKYYDRRTDLLHLVRPCIHSIAHAAMETIRCGPLNIVAQWALENTIGNLGREVRQPSNPFSNLSQRGLLRAQVNAITAMVPGMEIEAKPPLLVCQHFPNRFTFLCARDEQKQPIFDKEDLALRKYLIQAGDSSAHSSTLYIQRWARLRLPNGQVCRSAWKELEYRNPRIARNVQVCSFLYTRYMFSTST
jgi:hypothetical protein